MNCQLHRVESTYRLVARKVGRRTVREQYTTIEALVRAAMAYRRHGYILATR